MVEHFSSTLELAVAAPIYGQDPDLTTRSDSPSAKPRSHPQIFIYP